MEEVTLAFDGVLTLPDNAVLLTFDDGYIDYWTNVFPLLSKYGIQGTFFVSGEGVCDRKLMDVNCIQFIFAEGEATEIRQDLDHLIDAYRVSGEDIPPNDELFKKYAIGNRFDSAETMYIKRLLQKVMPKSMRHEIVHILFEKYSDVPESVLADELYMNVDQLRCMRNGGMHVGIHGYEHVWGLCRSRRLQIRYLLCRLLMNLRTNT